jgi:hypothetical protein
MRTLQDFLDEFYAMSGEERHALVAKVLEGVNLAGLPRAAARLRRLVRKAAADSEGLIQASKEMTRAEAEAAEIMSMLETASLHEFYKLAPVSGLTLLAMLRLSDEKTAGKAQKIIASNLGRLGAAQSHKLHNEARDKIKGLWASGEYTTKNDCADANCHSLGMAYDTARNHLKGARDPAPWPAKQKPKSKKK